MERDLEKYIGNLSVIASTRLVFNTMNDLQEFMGSNSISSNGIGRSFKNEEELRFAYNYMCKYVKEVSDETYNLDDLLAEYKEASDYYKSDLSRKTDADKERLSRIILSENFTQFRNTEIKIPTRYKKVIDHINQHRLNISIIVLLLLNVFNTYDSKKGDVVNMDEKFLRTIKFLEDNIETDYVLNVKPIIQIARMKSTNKTRLSILVYMDKILYSSELFSTDQGRFESSLSYREQYTDAEIEGYWNITKGNMSTDFWKIESGIYTGEYWVYHYRIVNGQNSFVKYQMILSTKNDELTAFVTHPKQMKKLIDGDESDESDRMWYKIRCRTIKEENKKYNVINAEALYKSQSNSLIYDYKLYKVEKENVIAEYDNISKKATDEYEEFAYYYERCIYAITREALYISAHEIKLKKENGEYFLEEDNTDKINNSDNNNKYYKIPIEFSEYLSELNLNSNVGRIIFPKNKKEYLAFDDILRYIPIDKIEEYDIKLVDKIE